MSGEIENTENNCFKTVAVIPAAGAGVRMGSGKAKQFLDLAGRPLLAVTLEKFEECPMVEKVILVVPPHQLDSCRQEIVDRYHLSKIEKVVPGGERRQDSVRKGIEASKGQYRLVLIHDGVRPLIQPSLIEKVLKEASRSRAVTAALPAKETVKEVQGDGLVVKTHDRRRIWLVQTPQAFRYEDIMAAHQRALLEGWEEVTDDALLVERMGITVKVVEGTEENIKVTTPHDLELARFFFARQGMKAPFEMK